MGEKKSAVTRIRTWVVAATTQSTNHYTITAVILKQWERPSKLSLDLHVPSILHLSLCLRPYHVEYTGSRLITEVKQRRARLVLGWVTAWEYRVP